MPKCKPWDNSEKLGTQSNQNRIKNKSPSKPRVSISAYFLEQTKCQMLAYISQVTAKKSNGWIWPLVIKY